MSNPSDNSAVHKLVQDQFGPVAAAYTISAGHSDAGALQKLVELVQPQPSDRALDIATGAGHTALAFAPSVAEVVAYDLTPQMLEETARNAKIKGLTNVTTRQGPAEALPFPDHSFEIVTCRTAPHHFANVRQAVQEMARVVKPDGKVLVVDTTVPEDPALDQEINYIEKRRDPSHVRNYTPAEWRTMFEEAGLKVVSQQSDQYTEQGNRMNLADWTGRMRTPAEIVAELAGLFRSASPALQATLEIEIRGDQNEEILFTLPKITLLGLKEQP